MYYLILLASIVVFYGTIRLVKAFVSKEKAKIIIERVMVFVLMAIFVVRFMSFKDVQFKNENYSFFGNFGGPMNPFFNLVGNLFP